MLSRFRNQFNQLTLSLACRSCLTTIVSASRRTWVTAAKRHRAARTIEPLSAIAEFPTIEPLPPDGLVSPSVQQDCASSYCSSQSFSMAIPRILDSNVSQNTPFHVIYSNLMQYRYTGQLYNNPDHWDYSSLPSSGIDTYSQSPVELKLFFFTLTSSPPAKRLVGFK